ncbi:MAG TPA: hypothetical protein ENK08_10935 [Chloroflexi bacterium]|nr:hypothetical protein [Chloroflexota bacterium]
MTLIAVPTSVVVLVAVFFFLSTFMRGGPPTSRSSRQAAGMLIYAVSSLPLACLRRGRLSCGRCGLRHQCFRARWVSAEIGATGTPARAVGRREPPFFLGEGLERVRRFLAILVQIVQLVNRLNVHLSSLLIQIRGISQMVRDVWRIVRPLSTVVVGQARP